jgi:hypothetical protein
MRPIDYRNETFEMIKARGLIDKRLEVFKAFLRYGPGTTREVSARATIDILNLRPRATELYQLGFLDLVEDPSSKARTREGIYCALSDEQAGRKFETNRRAALTYQPELQLK